MSNTLLYVQYNSVVTIVLTHWLSTVNSKQYKYCCCYRQLDTTSTIPHPCQPSNYCTYLSIY